MQDWCQQMDQARGLLPIDLVLRRAQLVNVFSGEIHPAEIGIQDGRIVGIGNFPYAREELDLQGEYVIPGLIDGHVHLESSHLCPEEFCSLLLAHGVTTAVIDPHEIANVQGATGIQYMIKHLERMPFNAFITLPSCVPATELETSGARLKAEDLKALCRYPQVIGLGEVMDVPGVLAGKPELVAKLRLPLAHKDGHAPGIDPQDLNAYFGAGMQTDHECSTPEEALERLRRGFYVMLREGSATKNLLDVLPAVNAQNSRRCLWVTDDRHCLDLLHEGSIDHLIRLAISAGVDPVQAIQMGTINAAQAFGLQGLGAIAPGYQADLVILNDLRNLSIDKVFWRGKLQSEQGVRQILPRISTEKTPDTIHLGEWSREKLVIKGAAVVPAEVSDEVPVKVRVIGICEHSLLTTSEVHELPVREGVLQADPAHGIAKIAVIERHQGSGRVGLGFVEGLGLDTGAIASTVAHDSHNLVVVGMSDDDMDLAVRTCCEAGGGLALVNKGQLLGFLALPIAGLMTEEKAEKVAQTLQDLHHLARQLGVATGVDPFMTLAFLSLPVIPELKITDLGLVDVEAQKIVTLDL